MELNELIKTLNSGEGLTVEYKEAQNGVPSSLYDTVASFSNTDGGVIILGVSDDGTVVGIPENVQQDYIKDVVSTLHSKSAIIPALYLQPVIINHPNGDVIMLRVPVSSVIIKLSGKVYWRSDDNDQDVTIDQQKISDIIFRKRNHFTESDIFPYLKMEHLDESLFQKARSIISSTNSTHPWLLLSDEKILKSSSLHTTDYITGKQGLTLAAALIFGKDETISNLLPGYKVDALVRRENKDRYDDRVVLRTNLIDTYLQLLDFVKKHLPEKFYQEGVQRQDLRQLIFREVVANIIVHREYTNALSTEFIIYKDKVVVTNPNKAFFHGPLNLEGFTPFPKNPNIRKFFTAFGWTDELGSGVRNINKYLKAYTPGAQPLFVENDLFVTEVPLLSVSLATYHNKLVEWFDFNSTIAAYLATALQELALPTELSDADWNRVILFLVPSWAQNGTKLKHLYWPNKQIDSEEEMKKVSSWSQNGTKILHKKTSYFIRILLFTIYPISLSQLMEWIDYSNRQRFRENYLLPLQQVAFIRMTKPNEKTASDQQYILTEKGKQFLTGKNN